MMDPWTVTSHVGTSPFCASNLQALALIIFGKLFCNRVVRPYKGHLSEHTQGGFSKQSKGNLDPLLLGLSFLGLL